MASFIRLCLTFLALVFLGGCAGHPIRHLASDASLIKPGVSTKQDVLTFLGDPDSQQELKDKKERWIYYEEDRSTLEKLPVIGRYFNAQGASKVIVTFNGDRVETCTFRSYNKDEFDWADDYSWQEKRD